ncbi:diadenosine tetraphosphate hydrolase [Halomonas sp. SF2003]|nr:diadenosine tetraphosphate hydrolase [Halomonas sp. SF2003]
MSDCVFCQIVAGHSQRHVVAEDEHFLAFLSIFPSTPGNTVVIPKRHLGSCVYEQDDEVILGLMRFTRRVARKLDAYFGVARTAIIFEGYGVNHLHAKLIPLHGTQPGEWQARNSKMKYYMTEYDGYVVSADGPRGDDTQLAALSTEIRQFLESKPLLLNKKTTKIKWHIFNQVIQFSRQRKNISYKD